MTSARIAATAALALALGAGACGGGRSRGGAVRETAAVEGVVVGAPAGGPVGGATIELLARAADGGWIPVAATRTARNGRFRLGDVPVGIYRLQAREAAGSAAVASARVVVAPPADLQVALRLAPPPAARKPRVALLAGRVQDERGAPVPLARVLVFPAGVDAASASARAALADADGRFRIPDAAAGACRLLIEAPGLGTMTAGPVTLPDPDVVVVLPGRSRSIAGTVTAGGHPVAGARVLLAGDAVPEARGAETDAAGRFAFGGLGPGRYALRAEAGATTTTAVAPAVVPDDRGGGGPATPAVALALVEGLVVAGRVVDSAGGGVGSAAIEIDSVPATGLWPSIAADRDGAWRSPPLAPGSYRIRARHPGFVARRIATIEIPRAGAPGRVTPPPAAVTLELARTGALVGRVVDDRGAPVVGATVYDRAAEAEELGVIWSALPPAAEAAATGGGALPAATAPAPAGSHRTVTDGDGRFAIGDVAPGRLQLEILHPSIVPFRSGALTLAPGQRLDAGTLAVHGAAHVAGRVVDADGSPIAGAKVTVHPAPGAPATTAGAGLYSVTAGDGAFSLPLPTGEHQVTASFAGRTDASAIVRADAAAAAVGPPIELRLGRGGDRAVDGMVRDAHGRPLARARIAARRQDDPEAPGGGGAAGTAATASDAASAPLATAVADAGGHFRLTGLPADALVVEVTHPSYPSSRHPASPGAPLLIEVPVPGGIDGEVHERITGAPVTRFDLAGHGPGGASARVIAAAAKSGSAARFTLRKLVPGTWTLRVHAGGYQDQERIVDVPSAPSPGEPSVRDVRFDLDR